jgi:FkbM family methyltransferase
MVNETSAGEVMFNQSPDADTAMKLLDKICSQRPVYSPRVVDKPLVLYGAGKLGKMAKEYLDLIGLPILFVVDANPGLYDSDLFWKDVNIFKPDDVPSNYKETALLAVCVATVKFSVLQDFLRKAGWLDYVPFYDITEAYKAYHPLSNGWFSGELDKEDITGTENVLCKWSDDFSRAHHLQFIAWHYLREEWSFKSAPVTTNDRYFIPEIVSVLHDDEVFVDIGAHHGDTTSKFMQLVNNKFAAIWIVEPDVDNLTSLLERFNQRCIDAEPGNIHVISCAIGDFACKRFFFKGLGYASQFSDLAQTMVEVKTIDQLNIGPTFIKMHLEGEEYNAFKGGIKAIQSSRPIIVTTTYHNRLGIWQFPTLIMESLSRYKFFFRQHSWCDTGSVMYAIPEERYAIAV